MRLCGCRARRAGTPLSYWSKSVMTPRRTYPGPGSSADILGTGEREGDGVTRWRWVLTVVAVLAAAVSCSPSQTRSPDRRILDRLVQDMSRAPTSDTAREIVRVVGRVRDPSYGAYLLDLVRIGYSSTAAAEALDVLADFSGIERTGRLQDEYIDYGRWVLDEAPEPGPDYAGFKAAIYRQADVDFVPLLAQITDRRLLAGLQYGGVGVGAIKELNDPAKAPISLLAWSVPSEEVYGIVGAAGTPLAYPERILARHELANDTLDAQPVAFTFCTLCRSVRVYDRRVNGTTLTFQTSGLLLHSNKVMVDLETGTLWQQFNGQALAGPLKGARLTPVDVEVTNWSAWAANHPTSLAIDRPPPTVIDGETGVPIGYDYQPGAALDHYYSTNELWYPVPKTPGELQPKSEVVGTEVDGAFIAIALDDLHANGSQVLRLGSRWIVAIPVPESARFVDATGAWPNQRQGPLPDGVTLANVPVLATLHALWFAWFGEHPTTDWWPRSR